LEPLEKSKGSDGGHNGLKSIQQTLNTTEYPRFRFGISDQFKKGQQVDYVLGEWNEEEKTKLPERLDVAKKAIESFCISWIVKHEMNEFNGNKKAPNGVFLLYDLLDYFLLTYQI
jgi:PTH1 family peptidyl-tRNA hydrolase